MTDDLRTRRLEAKRGSELQLRDKDGFRATPDSFYVGWAGNLDTIHDAQIVVWGEDAADIAARIVNLWNAERGHDG